MSDVLGNDPARWPSPPRWLMIAVAAAVGLAGVTWLAVTGKKPHHAGRPIGAPASANASTPGISTVSARPPAQTSSPPGPVAASSFVATFSPPPPPLPRPTLTGPAPTSTGVRLLLTSNAATAAVGIFALDGGAISPVHGFPAGGCQVGIPFRITGTEKWAVVWQPAESASAPCDSTAGRRLYIIDAATTTAHLVGSVEGVVPADGVSVWTVTGIEMQPAQQLSVPEHVQRISLSGAALSRVYAAPLGWTVIRGLTPDLLLIARDLANGVDNWEAWQPSTGDVLGQYEQVVAANSNVVVWVKNTCVPDNCNVHLSAPSDGTDRTVLLPAGAYVYDASLSDDGAYLALSLSTGRDSQGATNQDTGFLVDVSSRAVHQIQQTKIPAGETGGLSMNWAPHGWLIVNTPGLTGTNQLGAYNPTSGSFVVSRHVPPADEYAIF